VPLAGPGIGCGWRGSAIRSLPSKEVSVFKTIVWATDGSENADRAHPITEELARWDSSAVIVAQAMRSG
jgi:hypothetical protein